MLRAKSSSSMNELILTSEDSIKAVSGSNVVDKVSIVGKVNIRFSEFGAGFLTSKARLAFAILIQAFIIASVLHYFDSEYHI